MQSYIATTLVLVLIGSHPCSYPQLLGAMAVLEVVLVWSVELSGQRMLRAEILLGSAALNPLPVSFCDVDERISDGLLGRLSRGPV